MTKPHDERESLDDAARRLFAQEYPDRSFDGLDALAQLSWFRAAWNTCPAHPQAGEVVADDWSELERLARGADDTGTWFESQKFHDAVKPATILKLISAARRDALASRPEQESGSSPDGDTHRAAEGAVVGGKRFVLSALLSKQETGHSLASMMMGFRRCDTLDEATGSFVASIREEKPGFSIDEILSMEIKPDPARQQPPASAGGK